MITKKKKYILIAYAIIFTLTFTTIKKPVYAVSATTGEGSIKMERDTEPKPSTSPKDTDCDPNGRDKGECIIDKSQKFRCQYDDELLVNRKISINAYDMAGRSIIPYNNQSIVKFKAGTWIGINLQEYKEAYWNVKNIKMEEIRTSWKCDLTYYLWTSCTEDDENCTPECTRERHSYSYPSENYYDQNGNPYNSTNKIADSECNLTVPKKACDDDGIEVTFTGIDYKSPAVNEREKREEECKELAITTTRDAALGYIDSSSLEIEILNPNDVNDLTTPFINNKIIGDKSNYPSRDDINDLETMQSSKNPKNENENGFYYRTYEYSPSNVCINMKTSNVCYDTDSYDNNAPPDEQHILKAYDCEKATSNPESACYTTEDDDIKYIKNSTTTDEYFGENGEEVEYWHYFIPQNTPTSQTNDTSAGFYLRIGERYVEPWSVGSCLEAMIEQPASSDNPNDFSYCDVLRTNSGEPFECDYSNPCKYSSDESCVTPSPSDTHDGRIIENGGGCLFATKVKFNIEQKFYGEAEKEDGTKAIKGYGFYYRPINVNKPFPNNIAFDSIWQQLYVDENNKNTWKTIYNADENKIIVNGKEIKLDDSFKEITYYAENIKPNEIREINKEYDSDSAYTSWKNMNLDGTSKFIDELNLRKNVLKDSLYKLGCGPTKTDYLVNPPSSETSTEDGVVCP